MLANLLNYYCTAQWRTTIRIVRKQNLFILLFDKHSKEINWLKKHFTLSSFEPFAPCSFIYHLPPQNRFRILLLKNQFSNICFVQMSNCVIFCNNNFNFTQFSNCLVRLKLLMNDWILVIVLYWYWMTMSIRI